MNKIDIIFVDIDWTIFDHSNRPSVFDYESFETLKKAQHKGIKVFFNTARPFHSVAQIKILDYFKPDGMILSNGGLVLYNDEILYSSDIEPRVFEKICSKALELNLNIEGIRYRDCFLIKEIDEKVESLFATYPEDVPAVEDYHNQKTMGICLFAPREYDEEFSKILPNNYVYFRYHEFGVDIAPAPHDKGEAIKIVLDKLNISKENAMAIGDDVVDISMFKQVKYGVAMANGHDDVKAAATYVTAHVKEHGVKKILEDLLSL